MPKEVVVPHSNQALVERPLPLTEPFKVALFWVMLEAELVLTVG